MFYEEYCIYHALKDYVECVWMYFTSLGYGRGIFIYLQSPSSFSFFKFGNLELTVSISTSKAEVEQIISLDKQTWTDCRRPQNIDYVKFELQIKAQMKVNFSYSCKESYELL